MDNGIVLIQRAQAGDPQACGELYVHFEGMLRSYLDRATGAEIARSVWLFDLCLESFSSALDALQSLPPGATLEDFRGMLMRHALWTVNKRVEKHRSLPGTSVFGDAILAQRMPAAASAAGHATRRDEESLLAQLLVRLQSEQATVVRLRLAGLSFAKIAAELSIDVETARKRYRRGMRALHRIVKGD